MPVIDQQLNVSTIEQALQEQAEQAQVQWHRATIRLRTRDYARLKSIHPGTGVLQTIAEHLITKFINELERNNVRDFDPKRLEQCFEHCTIQLPSPIQRSPDLNRLAANESGERDDGRRTVSTAPNAENSSLPATNPGKPPRSRSRKATTTSKG